MGSKKHKKHKDHHKSGYEDSPSEQRPLKLVLKVGSSSSSNNLTTTSSSTSSSSSSAAAAASAATASTTTNTTNHHHHAHDHSLMMRSTKLPSSSSSSFMVSNNNMTEEFSLTSNSVIFDQQQTSSYENETIPRLRLAIDGSNKDLVTGSMMAGSSSSSSKKEKKHKKHKKHHKHGHHRSHHSHHHHRHHRRSSCSHHSKSSSSSQHHSIGGEQQQVLPQQPQQPQPQQQPQQPYGTPISIKAHQTPGEGAPSSSLLPAKSPPQPQPQPQSQPPPPPPRLVSTGGKTGSKSQFIQFLGHLLKMLQKRDMHDFFAWPVTDMIAPGYSTIISHPMDFSTMKKKIDQGLYETLDSFRSDVKLICDNAMVYNMPETIYYKAARKLWHYAKCKIFNKNILPDLAKPYPDLSHSQLGYDMDEGASAMDIDNSSMKTSGIDASQHTDGLDPIKSNLDKENNDYSEIELIDDEELTAEQILAHAKKSAKIAADKLTLEKPEGSHLSFLRQKTDGTTTLGIIGCQGKEKSVTLGSLVGPLTEGIPCLPPYKEPETNRIKLIDSVTITPFSSFLPSMDSTFATLNKEETQLLTSTYGEDEIGLHYTQSLLSFASDNDYVMNMVGSLLEVLTQGQHSKTMHKLKDLQKEKEKEKDKEKEKEKEKTKEKDKDKDKGIKENDNNSDIEMIPIETTNNNSDGIQPQLEKSSQLLNDLQTINNQRLSSTTQPIPPTDDEMKLANLLCDKLTTFISSHTTPADISDPRAIRKALGIQIKSEGH